MASQLLLNQLLDAEKKADEIVSTAKKNRIAMLKQAKERAEEEAKAARDVLQKKFDTEMAVKKGADPAKALESKTAAEVSQVYSEYENNKQKAIAFVAGKVLDVAVMLSETQKQALKTGM
eukprot:TRINITY_DN5344_c0_g1_i1.p2 TRINITY_DN5344_c0_g1~~TRINITY_DN5344_c0_g1_i1.p2  ORF type:complete len:120 (-),score=57.70 TRINITY_DN5344_c0_g1_i1:213-572(-)